MVRACTFLTTLLLGALAYSAAGQVRIPDRPGTSLFRGEQGKQWAEIHFDLVTGVATIKLLVQDPQGYFIPNIRREHFAVYENGVRQNADVEIEHPPVSLALLFEYGGRYPGMNKSLAMEGLNAPRQLFAALG